MATADDGMGQPVKKRLDFSSLIGAGLAVLSLVGGLILEGGHFADIRQASALLIVLGDLPLLTPADVAEMVALAAPRTVVLAPDRHGTGSNALLLAPPGLLPFRFGPHSAARHAAAATRRGLALRRYVATGTAFDIDTPADLAAWLPSDVPLPLGGSL